MSLINCFGNMWGSREFVGRCIKSTVVACSEITAWGLDWLLRILLLWGGRIRGDVSMWFTWCQW